VDKKKKNSSGTKGRLTLKQLEFCYEYVAQKGNGAAAAKAIGVAEGSARQVACRWLKNSKIATKIKNIYKKYFSTLGCDSTDVLRELQKVGFSNMADYIDWNENGITIKSPEDIGDAVGAIKELKIIRRHYPKLECDETETIIKLHDKIRPLEILKKNSIELDEEEEEISKNVVLNISADDLQNKDATEIARDYTKLLQHVRKSK